MATHEHLWGLTNTSMATRCLQCGIIEPDPGLDGVQLAIVHLSQARRHIADTIARAHGATADLDTALAELDAGVDALLESESGLE